MSAMPFLDLLVCLGVRSQFMMEVRIYLFFYGFRFAVCCIVDFRSIFAFFNDMGLTDRKLGIGVANED